LAGVACVVGISVGVGLTAPRWPEPWLARDAGPLRLTRWDTRQRYERLGVRWWKRRFPEGGDWAGGESKSRLPDLADEGSVARYIVETRRAEWVHWIACLSWIPAALFLPVWLTAALAAVTIVVNLIPIAIVRYNRLRLYAVMRGSDGG
jgi:glycosyl-4,4'-diaponeurosporenoate acyltransferase